MPTAALLISAQFGCAKLAFWRPKPQAMLPTSSAPAAQGTVKATLGDNGNTKLSIRVKHLAHPQKVASDTTIYLVWIQPLDGVIQNIGVLALNDKLEGSLDTMTPHRQFQLTVTPESSTQLAQPAHEPVFSTSVQREE